MHGEGKQAGADRREDEGNCSRRATDANQLIDAAWAALIAGRPQELRRVHSLLESPLGERRASESERKLARLHLLMEQTARNLRILRGNYRPSEW
jgi:hypothetical protein